MSEADKYGRAAEVLHDLHACLAMGMNESVLNATLRLHRLIIEAAVKEAPTGDDGPCWACGTNYPAWRAPHDLWNTTVGGTSDTSDPGGMLCPNCFLRLADSREPARGAWLISRPALTTTEQEDDR